MSHRNTERFRLNVKTLCAEYGAVQRVAEAAGISRVYLSKVMHGRAVPTIEIASKIADALEVPLSQLCEAGKKIPAKSA